MIVKTIVFEDFTNYKKPCMTIAFPYCSFKCDKECGEPVCQNSELATAPNIIIDPKDIILKYLTNNITSAICCLGLEPFDSFNDMKSVISLLREKQCFDDVVIYTGYKEDEIQNKLAYLRQYRNIIVKFGRYIPNQEPHYDEVLGVNLASDNQYAKRIS